MKRWAVSSKNSTAAMKAELTNTQSVVSSARGRHRGKGHPKGSNVPAKAKEQPSVIVPGAKSKWYGSDEDETTPTPSVGVPPAAFSGSGDPSKGTEKTPVGRSQTSPEHLLATVEAARSETPVKSLKTKSVAPKTCCPRFPPNSLKGATLIQITQLLSPNVKQCHAPYHGPVKRPPPPLPWTSGRKEVLIQRALKGPAHLTKEQLSEVAELLFTRALGSSQDTKEISQKCLTILHGDPSSVFEKALFSRINGMFQQREILLRQLEGTAAVPRRWVQFVEFMSHVVAGLRCKSGHATGCTASCSETQLAVMLTKSLFTMLRAAPPSHEAELECVCNVFKEAGEYLEYLLPALLAALKNRLRVIFSQEGPITIRRFKLLEVLANAHG
ncbi:uncharacterized protein LOC144180494 [Haemaphysalis longicornis]